MFVTCKLIIKVLKIRSNPVNFFWLVIRSGSGQNDPNPFRFGQNFRSGRTLYFSLMIPFFVAEFSRIPQLVPYLLQNFRIFLKWYHLCFIFSHFAQIGSTVFNATFCIGTFWRQKVKRGRNFWGV